MRFKIDDCEIACRLEGKEEAPVLIFSHSLATCGEIWRGQLAEFSKDYRVLLYDMRGHGDSDAPDYPYNFDLLADDVAGLMGQLNIARAVFVGVSIGGMIAQALSLRYPDLFAGLVIADALFETGAEGKKMWEERAQSVRRNGLEPLVAPTLERWFSPEFRNEHRDTVAWVGDMIRGTAPAGFIGCAQAIAGLNFTKRLPSITQPILVMTGEKDAGATPTIATAMAKSIPGAQLEIIPNCYHQTAIEGAAIFNRNLRHFLQSIFY